MVLLTLVLVGSATTGDVVDVDVGKIEIEVVLVGTEVFAYGSVKLKPAKEKLPFA